jgi:GNAT superfamily N-acetyltransferase
MKASRSNRVCRGDAVRQEPFAIRPAEHRDLNTLVALCVEHAAFERAAYSPEGKRARLGAAMFGAAPRLRAWVALHESQVIGYATATEDYSTWAAAHFLHMDCLFVRPAHRSAGCGTALLHTVVAYARARGLCEVQWQTPAWNTAAQRFYRCHGAVPGDKVRFALPVA